MESPRPGRGLFCRAPRLHRSSFHMSIAPMHFTAILLQLLLAPQVLPADGAAIMNPEFLDQFAATRRFSLGKPTAIHFAGNRVLFLRSGPRSPVQDLFEFDPNTGAERVL